METVAQSAVLVKYGWYTFSMGKDAAGPLIQPTLTDEVRLVTIFQENEDCYVGYLHANVFVNCHHGPTLPQNMARFQKSSRTVHPLFVTSDLLKEVHAGKMIECKESPTANQWQPANLPCSYCSNAQATHIAIEGYSPADHRPQCLCCSDCAGQRHCIPLATLK